ncbi:hypothetical protein GCM10010191_04760 [Actinomadura vinacea]|uniref:Uncharacterized protein n=2 Tax=Actinomadura vinacea TaxID=115336 RepID=A0ABN3IC56_9ACTN
MGLEEDEPMRLVVPARQAASLLQMLQEARLDAEETYWTQIAPGEVAKQRQGMPWPAMAERRDMLLGSDWEGVLAATPGRRARPVPGHLRRSCRAVRGALVRQRTRAGHHRSRAAAPDQPDPERRARRGAGRGQGAGAPAVSARIFQAHRFLETQPWPYVPPGYADPAKEQAQVEMSGRYRDFLTRAPYQRPPERRIRAC